MFAKSWFSFAKTLGVNKNKMKKFLRLWWEAFKFLGHIFAIAIAFILFIIFVTMAVAAIIELNIFKAIVGILGAFSSAVTLLALISLFSDY